MVELVIEQRRRNLGGGMEVGRVLPFPERLEHARAQGDHLHGIQAWVALPTEFEEVAPSFSHHACADLPQWSDGGVHGQVIAGSAYGLTSGVATHSPQFYAHLDMEPGSTTEIPGGHRSFLSQTLSDVGAVATCSVRAGQRPE
jgi:hypothetical protein